MPGLYAWKQTPTKFALDVVRSVLGKSRTPLSSKDIYRLAIRHEAEHPPADGFNPTTRLAAAPKSPDSRNRDGQLHTSPPSPPHPNNAIRSLKYLKHIILQHMAQAKEIEKFHTLKTFSREESQQRLSNMTKAARIVKGDSPLASKDVWLWRMRKGPPVAQKPKEAPRKVFGADFGVGDDLSHLNKRRQRARVGKVARDIAWAKEIRALRVGATRTA